MSEFEQYSPFDDKVPPESGAYNIIIFSRDRPSVPVMSVAYFDSRKKQWHNQVMGEYGYADEFKIDDNFISYYKAIDGVEFVVIPETYTITIPGVNLDDDEL